MLASMGKVHTKNTSGHLSFQSCSPQFSSTLVAFGAIACLAGCLGAKDAEKDKNAALEKEALTKDSSKKAKPWRHLGKEVAAASKVLGPCEKKIKIHLKSRA